MSFYFAYDKINIEVNNMSKEELSLLSDDGYSLSLCVYEAERAKANVMVVHGMEEYKERYDAFASFLQDHGYNVVLSDLRGHGKNAPLLSHIADKDGDKLILNDQKKIRKFMEEKFPDLPNMIFGHSMGTIITRDLLQERSNDFTKVALSGYVNPNGASGVAVALGNIVRAFKKGKGHSKMLTNLSTGSFNKAVKNPKTGSDWLSYNEENVQKYIDDPLCGVEFTVGSYCALFRLLNNMGKAKRYKNVNPELPFLLISGKDDPCTGGEKGRNASLKVLHKAGFKDFSIVTLDDMRHEILNELDKQKVYDEILKFFDK